MIRMDNLTISQVTQRYGVTHRMLRHYEKIGLIRPIYREDYAYRCYDEAALKRLQLIVILRKLRIPLKQIAVILQDERYEQTRRILQDSIDELDGEIRSLDTIRSILNAFLLRLDEKMRGKARLDLLGETDLIEAANAILPSKNTLKENLGMNELEKANETLEKNLNVRILQIPPFTVASNHVIGKDPEETVDDLMFQFIRDSRLYEIKPDSRYFGFNHPNPGILENGEHGYEVWATIPDDLEVPAPLVKKKFEGGLYAALTIKFPEFQYWQELERWVYNSDKYEPNYSELGDEIMGGCLEEHLNCVYSVHTGWPENGIGGQLDLLLPIKKRRN